MCQQSVCYYFASLAFNMHRTPLLPLYYVILYNETNTLYVACSIFVFLGKQHFSNFPIIILVTYVYT